MWFEALTGFSEVSPEQVRENLSHQAGMITSAINGRSFACGDLQTPTLNELRTSVSLLTFKPGPIRVREIVGNVQNLHTETLNAGALFQVASQFNLLEMVSPSVVPEDGVGIYQRDPTQGPACAIAAGAGTIFRNYFVEVEGEIGQTSTRQINCLQNIGARLGNHSESLWTMKNGYALATKPGLDSIRNTLQEMDEQEIDQLRGELKIGQHFGVEVTLPNAGHLVSQAYCSALPVAYSQHSADLWEPFARLILEAAYEATLCAAMLNANATGNRTVLLTLLGGGAFGNRINWILDALQRAIRLFQHSALDIVVVSYGRSNPEIQQFLVSQ